MKRVRIKLEDIAERSNLNLALVKAAKGKRDAEQVSMFLQQAESNLNRMAEDIMAAKMPYGRFKQFKIYDPKPRVIHAACFEDRIFHHAIINLAGPVLDKAMLPSSFACRSGLGVHRAVNTVQNHLQRFAWYGKIDIKSYFASIDQRVLMTLLQGKFKGDEFLQQIQRVLACFTSTPGKGLPIGSLTSQYFANFYLDGLDRLLDAMPEVRAHVRYMDDIVWWCDDKYQVNQVFQQLQSYLSSQRQLIIKANWQIQRSKLGISYCGYRVFPGVIRLSLRRKRRYQQRRLYWERQYLQGNISASQLQSCYAAVHAILHGCDSLNWRKHNLSLHPSISV